MQSKGKVILNVFQTLDGFIADNKGELSFLEKFPRDVEKFANFLSGVDIVFMGRTTYQQIISERCGPGVDRCIDQWIYPDQETYVITSHQSEIEHSLYHKVHAVQAEQVVDLVNAFKKDGKIIWLTGGHQTITFFLKNKLVDEVRIHMLPICIGSGIRLFYGQQQEFEVLETVLKPDGVVKLVLKVK